MSKNLIFTEYTNPKEFITKFGHVYRHPLQQAMLGTFRYAILQGVVAAHFFSIYNQFQKNNAPDLFVSFDLPTFMAQLAPAQILYRDTWYNQTINAISAEGQLQQEARMNPPHSKKGLHFKTKPFLSTEDTTTFRILSDLSSIAAELQRPLTIIDHLQSHLHAKALSPLYGIDPRDVKYFQHAVQVDYGLPFNQERE